MYYIWNGFCWMWLLHQTPLVTDIEDVMWYIHAVSDVSSPPSGDNWLKGLALVSIGMYFCRLAIGSYKYISVFISGSIKLFVPSVAQSWNTLTRSTKHRWTSEGRETFEGNRLLLPWWEWNGDSSWLHFTVCHGGGVCCWFSPRSSDVGQYFKVNYW